MTPIGVIAMITAAADLDQVKASLAGRWPVHLQNTPLTDHGSWIMVHVCSESELCLQ